MRPEDKQEFAQVIRATFDNYGRQSPLPETLKVWWASLEAVGMQQFRMACMTHIRNEPKFPPTLAQLLELLGHREPGKLGADEAWGIAVKACDETETVVMNDLIAQAWGIAKPIMDLGDEVGARVAFRDAYNRLMRETAAPVRWWPSLGSDPHKRDSALAEAQRAGLLAQSHVFELLPPPSGAKEKGDPEGLRKLKELMSDLRLNGEKARREADQRRAAERQAVAARKRQIAERIEAYQRGAA